MEEETVSGGKIKVIKFAVFEGKYSQRGRGSLFSRLGTAILRLKKSKEYHGLLILEDGRGRYTTSRKTSGKLPGKYRGVTPPLKEIGGVWRVKGNSSNLKRGSEGHKKGFPMTRR